MAQAVQDAVGRGFLARQRVAADDLREQRAQPVVGQQPRGELARLVGHHRQRDAVGVQLQQHLAHPRVQPAAASQMPLVMLLEVAHRGRERAGAAHGVGAAAGGLGHRLHQQLVYSLSDPVGHAGQADRLQAAPGQRVVERGVEFRRRLDQRSVEVEHHQVRQASGAALRTAIGLLGVHPRIVARSRRPPGKRDNRPNFWSSPWRL